MDTVQAFFTPETALCAAAALFVAAVARGSGALTTGGMFAAGLVGSATGAAGWRWAALLVFFFVSSTLLSGIGGAMRAGVSALVAKPGARDAAQVFANGGVFVLGALLFRLWPSTVFAAAALGALAAATSDTWATEIGTRSTDTPRSILTREPVAPGTSGGITPAGTMAGFAGALVIAVMGAFMCFPPRNGATAGGAGAVALGGVAGMLSDSVLGATVQAQRRCEQCGAVTERATHCGSVTKHAKGWRWLNNDWVNLIATLIGAGTAGTVRVLMELA